MDTPILKGNYRVRKACSAEEITAAQSLRYEVFNVELGEGLAASVEQKLDVDDFDAQCEHLIVEYLPDDKVVGTYRLQTGQMAASGIGYYSAQEFDLAPYEPYRQQMLELGRACIHPDHRKRKVLELLWRGIAQYALENESRYLIGCSSLTSQDSNEGWALYLRLSKDHLAPDNLQTQPLPEYHLEPEGELPEKVKCPKLFATYLSLGSKIAGAPAIDREFKTIDFLTIFDFEKMRKTGALDFVKNND